MKRMLFVPALLVACFFGACKKHTVVCHNEALNFSLVGFSPSETDTVVLKTFLKGTRTPAYDSQVITFSPSSYNQVTRGDTQDLYLYIPADTLDRDLLLPALNRRIALTDLVSEPPRTVTVKTWMGDKIDADCINRLLSYRLDGVTTNAVYENGSLRLIPVYR